MRATFASALIALFLLPAASLAQAVSTQTAAVDSAAAASGPAAPTTTSPAGGISRDQFIERAKDRAGQRAAARFDQMDANHDGVLDRDEVRAWRSQHPRRTAAQPAQPSAQ